MTSKDSLERNKANVVAFYDLMFNRCGKVIEHWDVLQVVPPHSKNDNTMF